MSRPGWCCLLALSAGACVGVIGAETIGKVETFAVGGLAAVNRIDNLRYPAWIGADDREDG